MPAAETPTHEPSPMSEPRRLDGWIVLVVEDEPLIGMDVTDTLTDAGAVVIGPIRNTEAAMMAIDRAHATRRITGAVLDVDLGRDSCQEIAARLSGLEVPFILHTGNWPEIRALIASLNVPVVVKPSRSDDIVETLAKA